VRALAHQLGVDLAAVQATGPGGSITSADVQRAARPGRRKLAEEAWEPLRGVRRTMARNMALARAQVAPATLYDDADVHGWPDATDPTLRLIRAVACGCAEAPALNAWYQAEAEVRHCHAVVDLGIAMNTDDGLFVPVLRDVGNRDDDELRAELQSIKAGVEARRLPPDAFSDQTITLSNFGTLGGRYAALVVVPPQVAILGAGRIRADELPLSLTFDHRVVTGAEAARFLGAVIHDLER
jgi:pyruvate dehydrogenase E2 component (dihydrolipoamide acetyltransferase)